MLPSQHLFVMAEFMVSLYTAPIEILELTPEREHTLQTALADLYHTAPESYDWMMAMMERITALEARVKELEKC